MPVYTLPQPDPRLAEPLHGFWNLPGVKWLLPSTPQDQAGSMGQPMGMAEPAIARGLGLAIALPEYLRTQFGKAAPLMQDWSQALPGLYRGYRAAMPGELGTHYGKGTFIARDLPYAQQYAAKIPSGGGGPVVHDVLAEVKQPLALDIPEHRAALKRAGALALKEEYPSDRLRTLAERMLDRYMEMGNYVVRIPKGTEEQLRSRGFDALLMPRELEGQYPTMIHLRPEGIRMTPRPRDEAEPLFAAARREEGITAGKNAVSHARIEQAAHAGILDWAGRLNPEDRVRVVSQLRRLMPSSRFSLGEAWGADHDFQDWAQTGDLGALKNLVGNPDIDALPLLSRVRRWESRAPTGARPMSAMELIMNHPARTTPRTMASLETALQALAEGRPEVQGLRDYLRLLRDEADQRGIQIIVEHVNEALRGKAVPMALDKLLYDVPFEMARGAFR